MGPKKQFRKEKVFWENLKEQPKHLSVSKFDCKVCLPQK